MRKFYLSGDIDEESFKEFCETMDKLEENSQHTQPVELILNSTGGSALDAIAFVSRMRLSSCDVNVTVFGLAGSAAVLILAAGNYRRMTKESWLMVHEDAQNVKNVPTSELEKIAAVARQHEQHWCMLLEDLTGTKKEEWARLHKAGDLYLTPEQCHQLGIVDEII